VSTDQYRDASEHLSPDDAQIREALKRSGYLLESRVERALRARSLEVVANVPYPDPYTGKSRELDLRASGFHKCIGDEGDSEDLLWAELLIECVHPPQPIAFFLKEKPTEWDSGLERIKVVGHPIQESRARIRHNWYWLMRELGVQDHHHYLSGSVASQYCSFERKKNATEWLALHREQDYEVIRALTAATEFVLQDQYDHMDANFHAFQLVFFYPVLIIQGRLVSVVESREDLTIDSVDHVSFHQSRVVGDEIVRYHIDVITESYLPTLLSQIDSDLSVIANTLRGRVAETWERAEERRKRMLAGQINLV
jgi:hypothetical protein